MKKLMMIALIVALSSTVVVYAQHDHPEMNENAAEVGNKICPVTGAKIGSMGEAVKHVYKGKVYNLCCPGCISQFDSDPEKYSKIVEQQIQDMMKPEKKEPKHELKPVKDDKGKISHYTCGMHPSVHVSVENYKKGDTKCPICFMPLTPVKKGRSAQEALGEGVISQLELTLSELKLAGVQTVTVKRQPLFKEIRAVGRVAYDPQLAIAQDEFTSAVRSYNKAKEGNNAEIADRAKSLVESSRKKLLLFGLNQDQIAQLEKTLTTETNLILPGKQMWVYGDVFEYELDWIKTGAHVLARPISLPGEEFNGEVVSINPVVDPVTRSLRFRALIDSPKEKLKPEMYVDIEIFSQYEDPDGNTDVPAIPKSALLDTGRRHIVWVDLGDGRFEGRRVKVGPEAVGDFEMGDKYYPVLEGIHVGEKVVTKGNFLIDSQSQITGAASASYSGSLEGHGGHAGH